MKKMGVSVMLILAIILLLFLTVLILSVFYSPGKPMVFLDDKGKIIAHRISEKGFIDINSGKL